jgi:hypothetical protein
MIDDILYEQIRSPYSTRTEKLILNKNIECTYHVVSHNGTEDWTLQTITVTVGTPTTIRVIVNGNIIVEPAPVYEDFCWKDPTAITAKPSTVKWISRDGYRRRLTTH